MPYALQQDTSWLPRNQTIEEANSIMQKSIREVAWPAYVPCVWVSDLENERHSYRIRTLESSLQDGPAVRRKKRRVQAKGSNQTRVRNAFMQYRTLVHLCFPDKESQTSLSGRIAELWATESREMRFFCDRNAAIESRIAQYFCFMADFKI
jgi:hypothetical protein